MTWDDLEIPGELQDVAQAVWDALQPLADHGGADAAASAALDELAVRYERVLADAAAIDHDGRAEAVDQARRAAAPEAVDRPPAGAEDRRVDDVGSRDLAKLLLRRVASRVSGRARAGL